MSPNEPSDNPWQEVRRGNRKNRGSSQGGPFQHTQRPSQLATNYRGLPKKPQPVLHATPNGRVMPQNQTRPEPATTMKKGEIPYEIKNKREWDIDRRLEDESESSEDDGYYDSDYEHPHVFGEVSSGMTDDRSQRASSQPSQYNPHPTSQPPRHPRTHPRGRPQHPRTRRPRVNFNDKRDNLARAAFRKRLEPTGRFVLPKDCPDLEPNQKRMYDAFEEMGVRLGSFIRPPQHVKDRELLLWGDARQIQNTKDELGRWLEKCLQKDVPRKPMGRTILPGRCRVLVINIIDRRRKCRRRQEF